MNRLVPGAFVLLLSFVFSGVHVKAETVWLDELQIDRIAQDWGEPRRRRSVDGRPLRIGGRLFKRGVGTHANSVIRIALEGSTAHFSAWVGVDDEVGGGRGSVVFEVRSGTKLLWRSPRLKGGDAAREVSCDISGPTTLLLLVNDAGDGIDFDHADWADARISYTGPKPKILQPFVSKRRILTPPPPPTPRINGPKVYGVKPGRPFLYRIPATGRRPMEFDALNLPEGLSVDPESGIISGKVSKRGTYKVTLVARNKLGAAQREFRIVVGDTIALTPPMGWNSWNCWGCSVDAEKIRRAADAMVASGLADHGFMYINIDDCWQGGRDPATGKVYPNRKFPDMAELAAYIHAKGLKFGVYTDCGPKTCAGYEGSKDHEAQDILTYAEWGVDYVKIDWCHTKGLDPVKQYALFGKAIANCPRDIVFSICNWGVKKPWEWGAKVGGNLWRTTGDIRDTWGSMAGIGFGQAGLSKYACPGHWNDPDMLVVGKVGWGPRLHDSRLKPDEQYTHISLWCLLAAPLLLGCDMEQLDAFTLNLLTNDEVLAVDQDPLGKQADRVARTELGEVWAKELEDGSLAVGLFNRSLLPGSIEVKWSALGISGKRRVRDLWRQKDVGFAEGSYSAEVPPHGVVLVRLIEP